MGVGFLRGPDGGGHAADGEGGFVQFAGGVGHEGGEGGGGGGVVAVPDPVDEALAWVQGPVEAGDEVGEDLDAGGVEEGEFLGEGFAGGWGCFGFGDGALCASVWALFASVVLAYSPRYVASVGSLDGRFEYLSNLGAGPVGSND